ncbi:serine/threonine-protein phosphatase 6 regulatory ankyrin repeat subunit B-like [Watersipora subatra]|uniref:serine/threonine-protein phosphatase 6 regulatory ankyrin repeat subunit B-like n=1 Tax=Watersipora subatra TaxID=2589382 RepID=UPI00355B11D6
MEELLNRYVRDKKIEIRELRATVGSIKSDQLLRLLLTIRNGSNTAVMVAAADDHTETCRLLLSPIEKISDELLWMKSKGGRTVLHLAVDRGDSECVELLLDTVSDERKYDFVAEKDEKGNTAIGLAAVWGRSKCIESLLFNFSSLQIESLLNIHNNYLYILLHSAAYSGQTTALKVMLSSVSLLTVSSLLTMKSKYNRTPVELAECRGNKETSELLKRWEKQPVVEGRIVIQCDTRYSLELLYC